MSSIEKPKHSLLCERRSHNSLQKDNGRSHKGNCFEKSNITFDGVNETQAHIYIVGYTTKNDPNTFSEEGKSIGFEDTKTNTKYRSTVQL